MIDNRNVGSRTVKILPRARRWHRVLSWLFAREAVNETVETCLHFEVSPATVWNLIMFYEEVPGRPPFPLRVFMPCPVRTDGSKTSIGATVRCIYDGGDMVKRITDIKPPSLIEFEVTDQDLGIEGCVVARGGSYAIFPSGDGTNIVLTTRYSAYLHPRLLWRPLEKLVTGQLHRHVLNGMRSSLPSNTGEVPLPAEPPTSQSGTEGELICAVSQSPSRH